MILVEDISEIQLIKNRLWNGVHAMLAWYASLRGHQTIGVALADPQIEQFMQQLLQQVQQGLAVVLPHRQKDLHALAQSFANSCVHAYKDPCARVARDPLRKLSASERVLGSIASNAQAGLPYQFLAQGALLGYVYAVQTHQLTEAQALAHLQTQLQQPHFSAQVALTLRNYVQTYLPQLLSGVLEPEQLPLLKPTSSAAQYAST